MSFLLEPGSHRSADLTDDRAVVSAMVRVELAWLHALAAAGLVNAEQLPATDSVFDVQLDPTAVEGAGNPVGAVLESLRVALGDNDIASLVHRGLTSQDTLDTALMLIARDALGSICVSLESVAADLAALADTYRDAVMVGRTLTQYAVPVTFGLKAAQLLVGVLDARQALVATRRNLPAQCGGAAGTLALAADLAPDPLELARVFAERLGLTWPGLPWHTRRTPITRLGDALAEACDAVGVIATNVLLLGRPEIGEVREVPGPGRGGSSTMPHKENPVLAVLVHSAASQAPLLAAQLHESSARSVDERPDGAWHAEWPALRRLLSLAVTAASQTAELLPSLRVASETMRKRAESAAELLTAERRAGSGGPMSYLGATTAFIDAALHRYESRAAFRD